MLHYPKGREDWLALRHQFVSSTESAAVFGHSPYLTPYELAVYKSDKAKDDFAGNERTEWGLALQRPIADKFAEKHGLKIRALNAYAARGAIGASFDFEIVGAEGTGALAEMYRTHGAGVLEIKNVDAWIYKQQWVDGEAPAHIEIQVQHQLEAIEREWAIIGVLVGGNRMEHIVRWRDKEVGRAIDVKCTEFLENLKAGVMPPIELPADAEIIRKVYSFADPGKVLDESIMAPDVTDQIVALCGLYEEAGKTKRAAEEAQKSAQAQLLQLIGTAEKVVTKRYGISAGMVAACHIEYDREPYRLFRVTAKKEKSK
jgi:putative phage-type endonuclease